MNPEKVFLRRSSGVVRAIRPIDWAIYVALMGWGSGGMLMNLPFVLGIFPTGDILTAFLFAFFTGYLAMAVIGAMLGAALPRSGGDYVWQSRVLGGAVGFATTMVGWTLLSGFLLNYMTSSWAISSALGPGLGLLGAAFNMPSLVSFSVLAATSPAFRMVISILLLVFVYWILTHGIRWYINLQNFIILGCAVAFTIIIFVQYLVIPKEVALGNLTGLLNQLAGPAATKPDWYNYIIDTAKSYGVDTNPALTLRGTLLLSLTGPILIGSWALEAAVNFGEIKNAENLRSNFWMLFLGTLGAMCFGLVQSWMSVQYFGRDFIVALGYLAGHHPEVIEATGLTWRGGLLLAGSVLMSPIVIFIMTLGLFWNNMQSTLNQNIALSRVTLAQSFDRVLPGWFGGVNKHGAPRNILLFSLIVSALAGLIFEFNPTMMWMFSMIYYSVAIMWFFTGIAAIIFPFRAKKIWEKSPGAKYKIAGIPLLSIFGVVLTVWFGAYIVGMLIVPEMQLASNYLLYSLVILAACVLYFFLAKWYRARHGIDISLAFREIPPA